MILRIYAIWRRDKRVLALLSVLWVAQVGFCAMVMAFTKRVPLPRGFVGCILTGSGRLFTPFWVMPLITDSVVFLLTILRTRLYANENGRTFPLLQLFIRDGTLYFLCIFSANLLNVVLFLRTMKAIGARYLSRHALALARHRTAPLRLAHSRILTHPLTDDAASSVSIPHTSPSSLSPASIFQHTIFLGVPGVVVWVGSVENGAPGGSVEG
ncbi:hypothetical protein JB92DRAFT_3269039 [Gautieria morchelliformis]|nr:hypothetical protein JB92DRAFT_3269039 [Gautieria morchelliformis]